MLLLNVSDIHFDHSVCHTRFDPDRPFRTKLLRDAKEMAEKLGTIDAILVTGDIAYHGLATEYDAAYEWLIQLAECCGCRARRIFVVPGNHDVDRNVTRSTTVRNVHKAIVGADDVRREKEFHQQFSDKETARSLFLPMGAYNAFAAKFDCQIYSPERMIWQQDLALNEKFVLRLHGLTSTFVSGFEGNNDTRAKLYLSPYQTVLDPVEGVINLVLCHHPPDWFMDCDKVDDDVKGRSGLHFFGHKHRQRITREASYVRFGAGAVNPDRNENGWEPGYNIVQIAVVESGTVANLDIQAHLRVWQTNPDMFRAKVDAEHKEVFAHRIPLGRIPSHRGMRLPSAFGAAVQEAIGTASSSGVEERMDSERTRDIVFRFWSLTSSARREISLELGITDAKEIAELPEAERYGRALRRVSERDLIDKLVEAIEKREKL